MGSQRRRRRYFGFEHRKQALLPAHLFVHRMALAILSGVVVLTAWVVIGIAGYHLLGRLSLVDSFLNAAMIVGGMGPVDILSSSAAKVFAGFYAILSGVIFLSVFGVLAAPIFHRFLHRFHLEIEEEQKPGEEKEIQRQSGSKPQ